MLTDEEQRNGCRLGIDSLADTGCAGKHARVIEFVEGKTVTAYGFGSHLEPTPDLPIANVLYAYDHHDGTTILLQFNQQIYLGDKMDNSLLCPNQCVLFGVKIDTRPKFYYQDDDDAQSILINDIKIPILHYGPNPYIPVRRPTDDEVQRCDVYEFTSPEEWRPDLQFPQLCAITTDQESVNSSTDQNDFADSISSLLMHDSLHDDFRQVCSMVSINQVKSSSQESLSPQELAQLWNIGIHTAERTLKATTHRYVHTVGQLSRRFRTDKAHLRYKRLATRHGRFYVDYLKSKVKSIRGFIGGNLYTNDLGFRKFFPMEKESQSAASLQSFIHLVGIPWALHSDNAKVYTQGEFQKKCMKYDIAQTFTEPYSPWQNRAETGIREVKSFGRRLMSSGNVPIRLWCFAFEYAADILSLMAISKFELGGRTPYEHVMNYTPDISEYTTFKWYQWGYYWDELDKEKKLCRWLGVAHEVGQAMCYWILIENGRYLARSSVIPIPNEELNSEALLEQMTRFDASVHDSIGDYQNAIVREGPLNEATIYYDAIFDNPNDDDITYPWDTELEEIPLQDQTDASIAQLDEYIGAHIVVPGKNGEGEVLARVHSRKRDTNGNLIGERNTNPILDTRVFNLEYPDGHIEEYTTNIVAENLYSNVDENGYSTALFDEIIDHRSSDKAVKIADGYVTTGHTPKPVITTKGWDLKVRWQDGTYDWIPLSQLKESNPVQVAEYACSHNIHKEPAFNWWVPKVIRKRDRLINKVVTRQGRTSMKFGVEVPRTVKDALELDRKNGNTFWADAIKKEMDNVKVAFNILGQDDSVPPGFTEISCHLIFDVKFDLTRKARFVAGGHLTDTPSFMTYASVVSRESVRIAFTIAALNDLDVLSGDIGNAYLNAPTKEKIWFRAGDEFGSQAGRPVIIVRALYGLKGSANAWRNMLSSTMKHDLGFKACLADPDVWLKPTTKRNGEKYYAYILIYTDDLLIIAENPQQYMDMIKSKYYVKPDSIGPPSVYLGANIQKIPSKINGKDCWGASAEQYVRNAVNNVKAKMKEDGYRFNKKLSDINYSPQQPFSSIKYRPELDTTEECNDQQANYYQNLIGILRWIVELGRVDIHHEVAVLSQYLANPRMGHLSQALHIFKYLDIHKEGFIAFDPAYLDLSFPDGKESDDPETKALVMKDFYPDAEEYLPPNAPEPMGLPVQVNTFVDADHAGNLVTRRSHTGILIFLNLALIDWFSKRQNTVESSTFSSEFIALKIAVEKIIALRYKLRMMGIPIEGPARVFCDNEAVYKNASIAISTLKKKHNSIAYHKVRESVAAEIVTIFKEDTDTNLADLLTKSTHAPERRKFLRSCLMRNIKVESIQSS